MRTANKTALALGCLLALLPAWALAGPAASYSESRGVETLRESGTNTQPYVRVSPTGEVVHYYVPGGNYNPYTSQTERRTAPPVGYSQDTQGNWHGGMGGTGYPNQKGLNLYEKERRE
ncbi:MAG: hypothetical protein HQK81_15285 [Desulfovibrionaceae bacterium]|nr:hypothetical protein [Desulfovibrionaceae bacterium]MBF0515407.1 hypothetical protein [Desulfovibrionaceae bacterium]